MSWVLTREPRTRYQFFKTEWKAIKSELLPWNGHRQTPPEVNRGARGDCAKCAGDEPAAC